ncbi:beta-lactamase family protein [bacterium]|nr:beta-lactamase family protein [bacterium]
MKPTRRQLLAAGAAVLVSAPAAALPVAAPADLGIDPRRLQHAYDRLAGWTRGPDAPVPGGAILVGRHGRALPPRFFGRQGPEPDAAPIREDALFLMASITKPVVYMAAMILVERGRLNLTDPVTRYVPEFAANGKGAVLVSHLFTHTSGLPDMLPNNAELRRRHADLPTFYAAAARDTTLAFAPGTNLSYQSMGTAVVADIVGRLSGVPVAEFVKREIFAPLGLASTRLGIAGLDRDRVVRVQLQDYQVGSDFHWNSRYWQDLGAPWGGMFSTPADFAVVLHLLLNGGAVGGVRVLSPASVRMMTTNRLNDYPDLPEPLRRTQPWGLGWRLNHPGTPGSWGDLLGRDVFGHTGATGTLVWADPQTGGFAVILTNALREWAPWRLVHLSNAVAAAFV